MINYIIVTNITRRSFLLLYIEMTKNKTIHENVSIFFLEHGTCLYHHPNICAYIYFYEYCYKFSLVYAVVYTQNTQKKK